MNKKQILKTLSDFIAIQSVSADSKRFSEMKKAVNFLKNELTKIDAKVDVIDADRNHPLIVATIKGSIGKKTIGIYGHYDVQHEDPVKQWKSAPFRLINKNGKFFGRGVADNKGHVIQNIAAVSELKRKGELKDNVLFLIEGEEETGSERFEKLLKKCKNLLKRVDVFFVTDVKMYAKKVPQINYALRGLVYFQIDVSVGKTDLHSGVYGNAIINPVLVLSDLFSKMKDISTRKILIPGFSDDVRKMTKKELDLLIKNSKTDKEFQEEMNSFGVTTIGKVPAYLAPKIFPSLDVHGITSGHTGEGPKTVIPATASAKFSARLIEYQKAANIEKKISKFIKDNMPKSVRYELKVWSHDSPFYCAIDNEFIKKTADILSSHFGNKNVFMREGGSVPAAEIIQRLFDKPVVLTGFILPDSFLHAPNENFDEEMFWSGIKALKKIYKSL